MRTAAIIEGGAMDIAVRVCCGLDVHKDTVVACLRMAEGRAAHKETRTFKTTTRAVLDLRSWLEESGCERVMMESTGSYWKPIYNLFEDAFDVWVVNAHKVKGISGRKTDVKDAEWLAMLAQHGLVEPSFIPRREQRELRELVRHRTSLVRSRVDEVNRVQKVLEGGNIKLGSVVSNVMGVSGQAMVEQLASGETDVSVMADLARGTLRKKKGLLEEALEGAMGEHQRFMLTVQLKHIADLDALIAEVEDEIDRRLAAEEDLIERLVTVPGVNRRVAQIVLAEVGPTVEKFPSSAHFAAWLGLCPGNNESAGKRLSGAIRRGSPHLKAVIVQASWASVRSSNTYLNTRFRRIAARRGAKRALIAVAHALAVILYTMIKKGTTYQDLGADYQDPRDQRKTERRLMERAAALGFDLVRRDPTPAAAVT